MMRALATALALSALGAFVPAASAQTCTLPSGVEFIRTQNCSFGKLPVVCRPGTSILLSADVTAQPNVCPYTTTWDFGDGSPVQVVTGNAVEHVFARSGFVNVKASVQTRTGIESHVEMYLISHGYFTIPAVEQVFEGHGFAIVVTRDDATVATTLDYQTMPSPFLEQKSGQLQFAAGEAQKSVPFKTIDTLFAEGEKTAQVSFRNPVDHHFRFSQASTTVHIMEDDEETDHRCHETALLAHEELGFVRVRLDRSGNLTLPSTGRVTIPVPSFGRPHWLNNTGTWSVEFAPGQASADVDIPLQNNGLWDGHQQTKVACGGSTGPLPNKNDSELLLTIDDDDPVPVVSVAPVVTVTESDDTHTVTVPLTLSAGYSFFVAAGVRADDDTATSDDYEAVTGVVTFNPGETSKPVEIRLTGDDLAERDEQFTVTLTGGDLIGKFKVRIVDDDRAPFSIALDQQAYEAPENGATMTLTRSGDVSQPGTVSLHFEPTAGHGGWPADFDVAFAAGQTTKTLTLPADDQWYTGDRTAMLELRTAGLVDATAEVTLHDDEPQPVVTLLGTAVKEGAAGEVTRAVVTILLSSPLGVDLDVRATTTPGTAGADDYTPLASRHISIGPGQMTATVTLDVRGDDVAEEDETFALGISQCCDPAIGAEPLTATVTIRDDDQADPPPPARRRSVRH